MNQTLQNTLYYRASTYVPKGDIPEIYILDNLGYAIMHADYVPELRETLLALGFYLDEMERSSMLAPNASASGWRWIARLGRINHTEKSADEIGRDPTWGVAASSSGSGGH